MKRTPEQREAMRFFPKGCKPPMGYLAWHEWAEAQANHGLKQEQCPCCKKWLFPQERHTSTSAVVKG